MQTKIFDDTRRGSWGPAMAEAYFDGLTAGRAGAEPKPVTFRGCYLQGYWHGAAEREAH